MNRRSKAHRLDMRMDKEGLISAYDVVNNYARDRLVDIFYKYGEEHNAKKQKCMQPKKVLKH